MITIDKMYISPVKALALQEVTRAHLDKPGISGDRAFFIVDRSGQLFTQRDYGLLVQVRAEYEPATEHLELTFPGGDAVAGFVGPGAAIATSFFGERQVDGCEVSGPWSQALSEFAGRELRLVKADRAGTTFDGYPLSMCSMESLEALARAADVDCVDGRRFRQNIYVEGASAHEEDQWVGGNVRVGQALLRVKMRDPRCVVTTHSPDTGAIDMNTLKLIASYRTDQPEEVNFGVYCTVVEPGEASVGDRVSVRIPE